MKRGLKFLAVLAGVLALSCSWFDNYNDIEYPAAFYMAGEVPGDPITLELRLSFDDQTPDTSGVIFDWEQRGNTMWFLLKGAECDIEGDSLFDDGRRIYVSDLDTGTYTLLFEGEEGIMDTFHFEVEDSVYRMVGDSGKVVELVDNYMFFGKELRRLYPDMLLVDAGWYQSVQRGEYLDSLHEELASIGAVACTVSQGQYTIFHSNSSGRVIGYRGWDFEHMDDGKSLLYTYKGDTVNLETLFETYKITGKFQGLSFRMGNGFNRLYQGWDNF